MKDPASGDDRDAALGRGEGVEVLIALGSNLGPRRAQLDGAVRALDAEPGVRVVAVSPWIETAPEGGPPGQGAFLNGVLLARTTLDPRALLARMQAIETSFGRDRTREVRNGPRTLDLDLLEFGDERIDEPGLTVPHPRYEERTFVLEPLRRLLPGRTLPRSGRTVGEQLARLERAPLGATSTGEDGPGGRTG